jgi:hypothetical protein
MGPLMITARTPRERIMEAIPTQPGVFISALTRDHIACRILAAFAPEMAVVAQAKVWNDADDDRLLEEEDNLRALIDALPKEET